MISGVGLVRRDAEPPPFPRTECVWAYSFLLCLQLFNVYAFDKITKPLLIYNNNFTVYFCMQQF